MSRSRDRLFLGVIAIILLATAAYLSLATSVKIHNETEFCFNLEAATISVFNIAIILGWLAFGNIGGALFFALSVITAVISVIKTGHYLHYLFVPPLFLTALAAYAYRRSMARIDNSHILKMEKLEEDINLLSNSIAEKKSGIISLNEKLERYSVLKEVVERLSSALSLEEINKLMMEKTLQTIGKEGRTLLFLVDMQKQELILSASKNAEGVLKVETKKGDAFDHWVLRHRKPLIVEDVIRDFRFPADDAEEAKEYFRSLISTPLISENKVIGILRMDNQKEFVYTQDDLRLLDILSDLGAVSIQNNLLYSKTEELAIRDGLTGLFLRRYFLERFREEIKRVARKKGELSFLILDIDHFKEYNDKYGHMAGDLVLRHLANTVNSFTREGDITARYGGEEIAILLCNADRKAAIAEAELIRKRVEESPLILRRQKMGITVSIGVSNYPDDAILEEELIRTADERLYKAKAKGRNRVCAN